MAINKGKKFEGFIREAFEKVPDTVVVRIPDQTTHYKGSTNPCDFLVFRHGHFYGIECKTIHGNTFPFTNLSDYQYSELLKLASVKGCYAGIICWWVDKDITLFIPIQTLNIWKTQVGLKSVRYDIWEKDLDVIKINGKKKRVFFDYDMNKFFEEVENV